MPAHKKSKLDLTISEHDSLEIAENQQVAAAIFAATPKDLHDKYQKFLRKWDFVFVNLLVMQNLSPEDAIGIAYQRWSTSSALFKRSKASLLLGDHYRGGHIKEYYNDLLALKAAEMEKAVNWSKEDSIRALKQVISRVDEDDKPYFDAESHEYKRPPMTKAKADAKINAVSELDKIMGYSTSSKVDVNGVKPVVFAGEEEIRNEIAKETKGSGNS